MATVIPDPNRPALMANAVSLFGNFVASIANVAPSSSVAVTLALLVSFAGLATPLAVLVVGVFMLFVALGYARLNHWLPNAGAPYVWVGKAVAPILGYAIGIIAIIGPTLSNIGNMTLAGGYTLGIISPGTAFSNLLVWVVAVIFMGAVTYISLRGIRPSIWVQVGIMIFEYIVVLLFVGLALKREIFDHVAGTVAPSLSEFSLSSSPGGITGLAGAFVICVWLYAGWEVPVMLGEESKKPHLSPGQASVFGTIFVMIYLTFLVMVFEGVTSQADLQKHGTDILGYAGGLLAPQPWGRLLSIAVLSAVFATTQMQLNSTSRVMWAMGRERLLPASLARVHRVFKTPIVTTLLLGCVPVVVLVPYLASASASTAIGYVISAAGILYTLMYAVIAVACVWYYRRKLTATVQGFVVTGLLPLLGSVAMFAAFIYAEKTEPLQVSLVVAAIIVIAVVAALIARAITNSPYFTEHSAAHDLDEQAQSPAEMAP
jgi:amino acid transporter